MLQQLCAHSPLSLVSFSDAITPQAIDAVHRRHGTTPRAQPTTPPSPTRLDARSQSRSSETDGSDALVDDGR